MSPCNGEIENGFCKGNMSAIEENQEVSDGLSQPNAGKPPRNHPGMRHCISQANLGATSALVSGSQFGNFLFLHDSLVLCLQNLKLFNYVEKTKSSDCNSIMMYVMY